MPKRFIDHIIVGPWGETTELGPDTIDLLMGIGIIHLKRTKERTDGIGTWESRLYHPGPE